MSSKVYLSRCEASTLAASPALVKVISTANVSSVVVCSSQLTLYWMGLPILIRRDLQFQRHTPRTSLAKLIWLREGVEKVKRRKLKIPLKHNIVGLPESSVAHTYVPAPQKNCRSLRRDIDRIKKSLRLGTRLLRVLVRTVAYEYRHSFLNANWEMRSVES